RSRLLAAAHNVYDGNLLSHKPKPMFWPIKAKPQMSPWKGGDWSLAVFATPEACLEISRRLVSERSERNPRMVIPIGVCTPTGPQRGARNPRTLFRVRFSWASLFRWYALKNARVLPAIVLSRLRRAKNGQTPVPSLKRRGACA